MTNLQKIDALLLWAKRNTVSDLSSLEEFAAMDLAEEVVRLRAENFRLSVNLAEASQSICFNVCERESDLADRPGAHTPICKKMTSALPPKL